MFEHARYFVLIAEIINVGTRHGAPFTNMDEL